MIKTKRRETYLIWAVFIVLTLVTVLLMARAGVTYDGDYRFHWQRMMLISHGELGVVHQRAVMLLYPWLTFVPLTGLAMMFKSPVACFYLFSGALYLLCYLSSYYSYRLVDERPLRAFFFSIIYTDSVAVFNNLLVSGSLPSAICLILLPPFFFGMIKRRWWLVLLMLALIGFTHVPTFVLALCTLAGDILFHVKHFKSRDKKMLTLIGVVVLILVALYATQYLDLSAHYHIVMPKFTEPWSDNASWLFNAGLDLGLLTIVSEYKRFDKLERGFTWISAVILLLNFMPIYRLVHLVIPFISAFQYVQRLNFFVALFGTYLAVKYFKGSEQMLYGIVGVLIILVFSCSWIQGTNLEKMTPLTRVSEEKHRGHTLNEKSYRILAHHEYNDDYKLKTKK